ncbi:unnamed protein product [Ilex paraguariensis]|uniref:Uncharacterized protein n=1 Tax=Ilex paraguariensis TaxID=185542 RepID=A0ABC8UXP9_9AQUA
MALAISSLAFTMLLLSVLVVVTAPASGYEYGPKPKLEKPAKTKTEKDLLVPAIIGVQGLIYCKSGPKLIPLKGAVTRITCLAVDENGYESAPFSVLSRPCDEKGYFFATLSPSQIEEDAWWRVTECKAFLANSPIETCKVPTDVNKGITGAPLASYRHHGDKNMKLHSVGPFIYTSDPKPISNSKGY